MIASAYKPVIFLACVNSYRNGKRLRHFVNERKAIARMFSSFTRKSHFQAVEKGNISNQYFFNLLQQNEYHKRLTVMHFVGPENGNHLRIESDDFEVGIHIDELSKLIGMLPNLQAVFLSGCATPDLVEMLIRRDIPVVLVTQTVNKNTAASAIAMDFYRRLAQGKSIQKAVRLLQQEHPRFRAYPLHYDIESDQLDWEKRPVGGLKWGAYFLNERSSGIESNDFRRYLSIPVKKPQQRFYQGLKMLRIGAVALLLGLLAAGITMYFQTPEQLVQLQQALAL
jgi:hypothetical protein